MCMLYPLKQSRGVKDLRELVLQSRGDASDSLNHTEPPSVHAATVVPPIHLQSASAMSLARGGEGDMRVKLSKLLVLSQRDKEYIVQLEKKLAANRIESDAGREQYTAPLQAEIETLRSERDTLSKQLQVARLSLTHVDERHAESSKAYDALTGAHQIALSAVQRERDKVIELQRQLHESMDTQQKQQTQFEIERSELQLQLSSAKAETDRLHSSTDEQDQASLTKLREATARSDALQLQLKVASRELDNAHEENASLRNAHRSALEQLSIESIQLQDSLSKAELRASTLQNSLLSLTAERDKHSHMSDAGATQLALARSEAAQAHRQIEMEKSAHDKLAAELSDAQTQLRATVSELSALRLSHTTLVEDIASSRAEITTLRRELDSERSALSTALTDVNLLRSQLDAAQRDVSIAHQTLLDARMGVNMELQALQQQLRKEESDRAEDATRFAVRLTRVQAEATASVQNVEATSAARVSLSEHALTQAQCELRTLKEEHAMQSEREERRQRVLEKQVDSLQSEATDAMRTIQRLRKAGEYASGVQKTLALTLEQLAHFNASLSPCLSCTACTSLFNEPISLPCGHTFCRDCVPARHLQGYSVPMIACPDCSSQVKGSAKSTALCPASHAVPANQLSIVQGRMIYLGQLLAGIKAEADKQTTGSTSSTTVD
jgi:chromosome segregation ATPase